MVEGWSAPIAETCTTFEMPAARAASPIARGPKACTASKVWRPAFGQDADEVDDRVGALDRAVDRPAIAQIRLDRP